LFVRRTFSTPPRNPLTALTLRKIPHSSIGKQL
jgi:hypothetical protein